jgi:DNA-binding beta-propeller fold protein YncE
VRGRLRSYVSCLAVVGLLFAGAWTSARPARNTHAGRPVPYRGNAGRFLELTSGVDRQVSQGAAASDEYDPLAADFTPTGWRVAPAGHQVGVLNFPLGLAATPQQDAVLVSADSGGLQGITAIDAQTLEPTSYPAANLFMGLSVTKDGRLYASGGNANRVFRYTVAGTTLVPHDATEAATVPLHNLMDSTVGRAPGALPLPATDGIRVNGYPGASVLDGRYLFVAGTLGEERGEQAACSSKRKACSRLSVIDTETDTVVARVAVGMDAFALALDPSRDRLYVANWADEAGRGRGRGTVSVVDVSNPRRPVERSWTPVGHHPTALQLSRDRTRLFVANTNDDSITVLDTTGRGLETLSTESVRPMDGVPVGAHPDALALSPGGETLFVALAGMNAVEVRDGRTGARVAGRPMYIPTGWYPSALLVTGTARDYKLWIANAKGAGASTKTTGFNFSIGHEILNTDGTVSVVDLPAPATQARAWTEQVDANDRLSRAHVDPCRPGNGIRVSEVLCPPSGKRSPIEHVVYIVTENKTFDQYFGDLGAGFDADLKYLLYGQTVTPNHHALADRYSLSDRFFSDAQVSVTGHSWTSGAIATDHNEKTMEADYDQGIRGSHGNDDPLRSNVDPSAGGEIGEAEDELNDPEGGYIFEAFKRARAVPPTQAAPGRLSMAIYGERTARESGSMDAYKAPAWQGDIQYFDTCRALLFTTGSAPNGPAPDDDSTFGDCGGRKMPAAFNLAHWTKVAKSTGRDIMPSFIYMTLPVNHTLGTNLGSPTPASMVADNDHAFGLIVDALSKSPFWSSTVVIQTEDDTQAAGDHISPLRDYLQVVGPWAQPGPNHQWGSMPSLLRTIEQIFEVKPITLFDRLAYPQHAAFRTSLEDKPDLRPYTAVRPLVPFAVNGPGAPGQEASMAMDWSTYDRIDMHILNAILYADARGKPYHPPRDE